MKEKIMCNEIENHLMDKISTKISHVTFSSCITCQSSEDIIRLSWKGSSKVT